jgi:GntR family transcriptional regulator / MocR family aminotransferase
MALAIPLSRGNDPLFLQVYRGLRDRIVSGAFPAGSKLPSTRAIAEQLGISRTVAVLAYEQLLVEGYANGRGGSGTYVSGAVFTPHALSHEKIPKLRLSRFGQTAAQASERVNAFQKRRKALPYNFAYGRSDLETFPFEMWRRTLLRCARRAPVSGLDYGPSAGSHGLREAVSVHLRRSRAVNCEPSQVIITSGSHQALDIICRVLIGPGDPVALENPSYEGITEVLRASRARMFPVSVDGEGLDPKRLPNRARVVFVTPSHQFPTGAILPLKRRVELLRWAGRGNAIIVEDDYDGEFRYEGHPLESLQGLDREGRVIYVGTFSRTVFSSLRIGYLVAPKQLVEVFTAAKWLSDRQSATLEQEALADFISSGMYERYLRRVRRRNTSRRHALLDAIHVHLGDRVEVTGDGAGAHVVLWPKKRVREAHVIAQAALRGVAVYGISPYFLRPTARTGILLGYSRLSEKQVEEGICRLGEVL